MSNDAMQSSDSSSDSDSDSGPEDDIKSLEAAVNENPNNYEAHEKYMSALRKAGEIAKLRNARENMNAIFSLSGKLWQEWTQDEIRMLTKGSVTPEEVEAVKALYERGVSEFLYVPLWVDYLEFVEEHDPEVENLTPNGLAKMRDLCERAIVAAGLHMAEGGNVWTAYHDFEEAVLITMENVDTEVKEKQAERARKLYHRELAVPLVTNATTLGNYKQFEVEQGKMATLEDDLPGTLRTAYERAAQLCEEYAAYEEGVRDGKPLDAELYQNFLLYISMEESKGDPGRVQIIFERAVAAFPAAPDLWLKYVSYVEKLKIAALCKSVYKRAVRNCFWSGELWRKYLLGLERFSTPEDEMSTVFEQAIEKFFQTPNEYLDIFLTRIDGLRRRMQPGDNELLRDCFSRGSSYLATYFPDFVDRSLQLHGYWADMESRFNDLEAARRVWETIAKTSGWMLEVWQGYIAMELRLGNIKEARAIYKRCHSRKFEGNGSEMICQAWIRFEREHGSLDDYDRAVAKAGKRLEEVRAHQLAQEAKAAAKGELHEKGAQSSKRKREKDVKAPKKRQKVTPKEVASGTEEPAALPLVAAAAEPEQQPPAEDGPPRKKFPLQQRRGRNDQLTVFVSNLGLKTEKEDVRNFFASCPGLKDVRVPRDKFNKSTSRRIAYVEFEDEEGVNQAILKNKTRLNGRKISVARSDPEARKAGSGDAKLEGLPKDGAAKAYSVDGGEGSFKSVKPLGWSAGGSSKTAEAPKSNNEFRKMFLKK